MLLNFLHMPKEKTEGVTVKKDEDIAEWYSQVCIKAELADYAPTKGCMIIRPRGYAIWQNIQDYFNARLKKLKVENAYFPLFIPEKFFKLEKEHAKGFSPEVAWIEKRDEKEERIAVRPTSETIMYDSYARWVRSHRDLPLRINQWCNIVRWETEATKLFIRSREFLWQEGHCVYETEKECEKETLMMLEEYRKLAEEILAIPVMLGAKTKKEKFAGAKTTYTIEALMPDGKALQMGTSHNLGQGFSESFGIRFLGKNEKEQIPWQNSWGVSTRMIGAVVLTHSDDKGLVLPPKIAPVHIAIIPIIFEKDKAKVLKEAEKLKKELDEFEVILDDRDEFKPGWKYNEWELKGVPLRIEIGPKDIEKKQVVVVRRDNGQKEFVKRTELKKAIPKILDDMQKDLFKKAKKFLNANIVEAYDWKEFTKLIKERKIVKTNFCGHESCEDWIKDKTEGATSRCIPLNSKKPKGKCVHCGKEATVEIYFSKSY